MILEDIVGSMHYFSKDIMDFRPPCKIYTMFLQEKWYEFQLSRLKEQLPNNLDTIMYLGEDNSGYIGRYPRG